MSRPRYAWWGYIREILRRYGREKNKCEEFELAAIQKAIAETRGNPNGELRLQLAEKSLIRCTHTLGGAAMECHVSYGTAKQWQQQFIRCVAGHIICTGLVTKE